MFSTAQPLCLPAYTDNRHHHFPTRFTDALGDTETRPSRSNAISMPLCFKEEIEGAIFIDFFFSPFYSSADSVLYWKSTQLSGCMQFRSLIKRQEFFQNHNEYKCAIMMSMVSSFVTFFFFLNTVLSNIDR